MYVFFFTVQQFEHKKFGLLSFQSKKLIASAKKERTRKPKKNID